MSTVAILAPAAVVLGVPPLSLLLLLGAGAIAVGMIPNSAKDTRSGAANWETAHSHTAFDRKKNLLRINERITQEMTDLLRSVSDGEERERLRSQLEAVSEKFRADIESGGESVPDAEFREIRQRLIAVQMDERMEASLRDEFGKIESARAADISLAGLVEERYTIPALPAEAADEKMASLVSDIRDFGARVAFFDDEEARRIRPLIEEAALKRTGTDSFRLSAIRDEIKMRYGKLKEQKALTALFKEELRGVLPLVKRARGAEALIVRMEELLTAREISRGSFTPLYEDLKTLLAGQLERIAGEIVAEKAAKVLNEMGYSLTGEDGGAFAPGHVSMIQPPYDGYRVKVKVDQGGALSARLVRVAESEEEKNSTSEYQRQKDIEVGQKWCKDLDALHERMKAEGVDMKTALRKEPEELPLDVIVEPGASAGKKRNKTAGSVRTRQRA